MRVQGGVGPPDPLRGLPTTEHNPATVEGRLEQVGKLVDGLRAPRRGWRRATARVGLVLLGAAVIVLAVLVIASR